MRVGIFGYGKMGRAVEHIALDRGHTVEIMRKKPNDPLASAEIDCAIDFTGAVAAPQFVQKCIDARIPVISGSTGWTEKLSALQQYCRESHGAMLWAPNFSVGMFITFTIN